MGGVSSRQFRSQVGKQRGTGFVVVATTFINTKMQGWSFLAFQTKSLRGLNRSRGPGAAFGTNGSCRHAVWNWNSLANSVASFHDGVSLLMQEWDWQVRWSDIRRFLNVS